MAAAGGFRPVGGDAEESVMRRASIAATLGLTALLLAACGTTTTERAATGGLAGAAVGAAVDKSVKGAVIGGAAGAAIGAATGPR